MRNAGLCIFSMNILTSDLLFLTSYLLLIIYDQGIFAFLINEATSLDDNRNFHSHSSLVACGE